MTKCFSNFHGKNYLSLAFLRFLASPTLSEAFFSADSNCWIPAEFVIVKEQQTKTRNENKSATKTQLSLVSSLSAYLDHMTKR